MAITVTRWDDPATLLPKLRIDGAEPREEMADELMRQIEQGSPWARTERVGDVSVLHLWDDFGHRYIYKITGYDFERAVYRLEWPD
jgi:hypothetical protein